MRLHELKPIPGSRKPKRIVGRGEGSTLGQTCGKGQKGQTCRSGDGIMNGFEGGQTPLMRRLPKRGFRHASKIIYQPVNLDQLESRFESGAEVTSLSLSEAGYIQDEKTPYKILGSGKLSKSLTIVASKVSKSAEKAIKKAGGTIRQAKAAPESKKDSPKA